MGSEPDFRESKCKSSKTAYDPSETHVSRIPTPAAAGIPIPATPAVVGIPIPAILARVSFPPLCGVSLWPQNTYYHQIVIVAYTRSMIPALWAPPSAALPLTSFIQITDGHWELKNSRPSRHDPCSVSCRRWRVCGLTPEPPVRGLGHDPEPL